MPITWWKSFYYYGTLVSNNCEDKSTILNSLHILRKHEKIELRVNTESLYKTPLNGIVLPSEFVHDHSKPVTLNYPSVSYDTVISSTDYNGDIHGMTQKSSVNEDDSMDDDTFNKINDHDDSLEKINTLIVYHHIIN